MDAVFEAITTTTTVDLGAEYVTRNAAALDSVAWSWSSGYSSSR